MNATMNYTDEWDKVLKSVESCMDCPNPACVQACPQSVNIREALRLLSYLIEKHPADARNKALELAARLDPDWGKGRE